MEQLFEVTIDGEVRQYPADTTLLEIAKEYESKYPDAIVLAILNGKLCELYKKIQKKSEIRFLTVKEKCGHQAYKRSATLLMLKAFYDVVGNRKVEKVCVEYSISKGFYCRAFGDFILNQDLLDKVKARMKQLVEADEPIKKRVIKTDKAIELFRRHRMYDKEKLFRFRRVSTVHIYSLCGFEDYFYGYMVPSTGYLQHFDLFSYDEGFILQMPSMKEPAKVPKFEPQTKLFQVQKESGRWGEMLELDTVGSLNEQIANNKINDIILVQEALQEKKISQIAQMIADRQNVKFVMIAGPSSSGKTTFSHRLSIQLRALGLKPHPIAVDDYFLDRIHTPRDEQGNYNFEILEALDVKQFNQDMLDLASGKEVKMPTFNFVTGEREYKGKTLQLEEDDILVIEGIHGLNDSLSYSLPKESKFKIYISALTQLNIDEHNRIPTTDGRLIRRIVRDARTRGTSAKDTIARWQSVRNGEENHIFPFQEEADVMFNSALIYELSVLKQYAEPLLFGIDRKEPEYMEAKRLLKFLDYFLGVSSEDLPKNSLIREFIGGSVFHV